MWIKRVWQFTLQMFPIYPNWVALAGGFVLNYFVISKLLLHVEVNALSLGLGSLSYLLFVYLLRVFDEIKDYPTDKINFPNRPLVAGVASFKDIKILGVVVITALCLLQVPFYGTPVFAAFLIVLGYSLLSFKWFFLEKYIRPSLPLALITHNPIVYLYQFYILSFFGDLSSLPTSVVLYLVGDGLGGTAWELSRKIRGTTQEDTYVTYTRIWGYKLPQFLVLSVTGLSLVLILFSVQSYVLSLTGTAQLVAIGATLLPIFICMYLAFISIKFAQNSKVAPPFRMTVEIYKMAVYVALIIYLFVNRL